MRIIWRNPNKTDQRKIPVMKVHSYDSATGQTRVIYCSTPHPHETEVWYEIVDNPNEPFGAA